MPKTSFYSGTGITSEKADAVESSANSAAQSAADAATSESNALTSETNAATSESNALTSETNAATSESNAATSESNAATSESNAATSEANALASATAAQNLEITSSSFDTTDGTLTLTKANSGTVTTDLDGRYADLTGATFTGQVYFNDHARVPDDKQLFFGTHGDLRIGHTTGNNSSFIGESGSGSLVIYGTDLYLKDSVTGGNRYLYGNSGAETTLYFNGDEKLSTTNTGVNFEGNITLTGTVDGVDIATLGANAVVDGDFTTAGLMATDGSGGYSVDSSTYATETYVDTAVSNLVDSAPDTLDTLNELASALGDDANFSTTVTNSISTKWTEDATKIGHWDEAYDWGDHDAVGYLTTHQDISGKANLSGATFTGNVAIGLPPTGTQTLTVAGSSTLYGGVTGGLDVTGDITVSGTVDGVDVAAIATTANSAMQDLVDDTTPQLGGTLDLNNNNITGLGDISATGFTAGASGINSVGNITSTLGHLYGATLESGGNITCGGNISVTGTVDGVDIATLGANAIVDGDFTSNGFMKRTGAGTYTVDTSSYVSSSGGTFYGNVTVTGIPPSGQANLTADFLKGSTTAGGATTPVIDLEKNVTGLNGTGRFIELNTKSHSTNAIITRGHLGLSQLSSNAFCSPYFSHNDGNCGFSLAYSGSDSYNAIIPASTTGASTSSNINLGHQYSRWNGVYLKISPNVSSDREYKRDIEELSEAEKRVAVACKGLIRKYRMRDAYEKKGESARLHIGIVAQDLQDAFTAEGLDAHRYGVFCSDTWHQATVTTEDEDGNVTTSVEDFELVEHAPEGATNITEITRLSVRYEELLAFIISTT